MSTHVPFVNIIGPVQAKCQSTTTLVHHFTQHNITSSPWAIDPPVGPAMALACPGPSCLGHPSIMGHTPLGEIAIPPTMAMPDQTNLATF